MTTPATTPADGVKSALAAMVDAMRWWAKQEDGMPAEVAPAFNAAMLALGWSYSQQVDLDALATPSPGKAPSELIAEIEAEPGGKERIAAARERVRSLLASPGKADAERWQPIETAPKDGTEILLYAPAQIFEDGKPVDARRTLGRWVSEEGYIRERRDIDGRYIGQDEFDGFDGWMSWDGGFSEEDPPTHWMPLPAAPQEPDK